jgi:hypothetical protein
MRPPYRDLEGTALTGLIEGVEALPVAPT